MTIAEERVLIEKSIGIYSRLLASATEASKLLQSKCFPHPNGKDGPMVANDQGEEIIQTTTFGEYEMFRCPDCGLEQGHRKGESFS